MEKITFVNGSKPALNAYNLNLLQDNIETDINLAKGAAADAERKADSASGSISTMQTKLNTIEEGAQRNVDEVIISNDRPDSGKIWIEPDEDDYPITSEVVNSMDGNQTNLAPSVKAIKNANAYSTNEVKTSGTWIDGKPIYRKVINCNGLPVADKTVAHNISNIDTITKISGFAYRSSDATFIPLPFVQIESQTKLQTALYANRTSVILNNSSDRSAFSVCYVTLEYTKTTD